MGVKKKQKHLNNNNNNNNVILDWASLVTSLEKNLPTVQETRDQSLGREDPLEKGTATHSSIPSWRIPWTEEPGGLQSTGSQSLRHDSN